MNPPVFGTASKIGSFVHQNHGRIGLLEEKQIKPKGEEAHHGRDVSSPAPSHVRVQDDEAPYEGSQERTGEDGHGEDCNGKATATIVEHVRKDGRHHGKRTRAENSAKEPT